MSRFIKYLLKLILLTAIVMFVSDMAYSYIYNNSETPRNKMQFILNQKNVNYDYVFLGSSRVANHIDAKLFEKLSGKKALNIGVEGAGLNDCKLLLQLLTSQNKVNNLYIQLDHHFESDAPSNIAVSEAMPFIDHPIIEEHVKTNFKNYYSLKYIPFYRYIINEPKIGFREMFLSFIGKKSPKDFSTGYIPKLGARTLQNTSLPKEINCKNQSLDEIVKICEVNNINLIYFISPYCKQTKRNGFVTKMKKCFPNLIDLSTGFKDEHFYNCTHLNDLGAKVFTENLFNKTTLLNN